MSKGLDALTLFLDDIEACVNSGGIHFIDTRNKDIVEKELKAFEFIKPYIQVYAPNRSVDRDNYMLCVGHDAYEIPKEIYNLFKEVLK